MTKLLTVVCDGCGKSFQREQWKVAQAMRWGKRKQFCSAMCVQQRNSKENKPGGPYN